MKIRIIRLLLLIIPLASNAQDLKTYNGPISNYYGAQTGSGSYTYYTDAKTKDRIKHGSFVYKDQKRNLIGGSIIKEIRGNFKNGNKDGQWIGRLTYKDFERQEDISGLQFMATGEVSLFANYKNGIPDGAWVYTNKTKGRQASKNFNGEIKYTPYVPAIDVVIKLFFKDGVMVDVFSYKSASKNIVGKFDSEGRIDGLCTLKTNQNEEITNYQNGVVVNRIYRQNTGQVIENEQFDKALINQFLAGNIRENDLSKYGIEDIDHRNIFKEKIINLWNTVYNNNDFLHTTINGDKTIVADNYGGIATIKITGGDFVKIKSRKLEKLAEPYIKDVTNRSEEDIQNANQKNGLDAISSMFATSVKKLGQDAFERYLRQSGEKNRLCNTCAKETIIGDIDGNGTDDVLVQYILNPTNQQEEESGQAAIYDNDKMLLLLTDERLGTFSIKFVSIMLTADIIDYSVHGGATIKAIKNNRIFIEKEDTNEDGNIYKERYFFKLSSNSNPTQGFTKAIKEE